VISIVLVSFSLFKGNRKRIFGNYKFSLDLASERSIERRFWGKRKT
jgi:hypothetical protein